ncbi:MFS multidrug transporter-like protein [Coleophoma cylindrospora]|uniref:MFS multidrug transporter-like protein n=1 Tax=Coleophoma cylindrospora TaxID=1849047 RepID=A0A3D8S8S2_9HELO|nr:MFS multidrug transporter-like protein [Coleophoma cylindrospora]
MAERVASNVEAAVNALPKVESLEVRDIEKEVFGKRAPGDEAVRTMTQSSEARPVTVRQIAPLVLILTGATFLMTLAAQAVVIILPDMCSELNIPEVRQQWIVSAFALTSGCFLLLAGKLGDVYGRRLLFILGCVCITAFALGTAFSPTEICLYVMRALHGVACAFTIPTAIGIIGYTIPPGRIKNYAFAFYSGGAPTGQVMGNIMGGLISQYTSWKVVFFVIAGASFVIGVTAFFIIPKEPAKGPDAPRASGVDWTGAALFTIGLLLLLIALSEGVSSGWNTPVFVAFIVVSPLLLTAFTCWEHYLETRTTREPMMRISTFRHGRFSCAMVIVMFFSAGFTIFLIYSTYYYQDYQGKSNIQTTIRFIPLGIVGLLTTFMSGFLLDRVRGNYILIFGLVSATIANLLFAVPIPPTTTYWAFGFPSMVLAAFGADTIYPCLGLFTTQSLPRKDQSVAGAMFQTFASIGRAIGLVIAAAIQTAVQGESGTKQAFLMGLRAVEWLAFGLMVFSLAVTIVGLRNIGRIGLLKKLGVVQGDKLKAEET